MEKIRNIRGIFLDKIDFEIISLDMAEIRTLAVAYDANYTPSDGIILSVALNHYKKWLSAQVQQINQIDRELLEGEKSQYENFRPTE